MFVKIPSGKNDVSPNLKNINNINYSSQNKGMIFQAMLKQGGLLIISSPYTWMEEHTPVEKWIGGFKKNGENFFTVDGLQELLQPGVYVIRLLCGLIYVGIK